MNVKPSQFDMLASLVDAANLRHRVLASNVANVNTPGYRRLDVDFESTLAAELRRGGSSDDVRARAEVVHDETSPFRIDGNNVDVDAEMGRVAKNTLLHNTYLQIIAAKNAAMQQAIRTT